jgi:AraC-like DNA-binding protein
LQDLLALTIGANRDARHVATGRGVAAARMALLKADIIERLPLGPVRIGDLATRHAISEVYIRKLFSSDGTTLTDFVAEKRLAAVHRGLLNPLLESQSISQLAYAAGFSDLSHFNRRFRQLYGCTPSEVRGALRN